MLGLEELKPVEGRSYELELNGGAVPPTRLPPLLCASDPYQEQATGLPELVIHQVPQQRQKVKDLQC